MGNFENNRKLWGACAGNTGSFENSGKWQVLAPEYWEVGKLAHHGENPHTNLIQARVEDIHYKFSVAAQYTLEEEELLFELKIPVELRSWRGGPLLCVWEKREPTYASHHASRSRWHPLQAQRSSTLDIGGRELALQAPYLSEASWCWIDECSASRSAHSARAMLRCVITSGHIPRYLFLLIPFRLYGIYSIYK